MEPQTLYRRLLRQARLALVLEGLVRALWPVWALALIWLGVAASGLLLAWPLRALPWLGQGLAVAVGALALWRLWRMRWPTPAAVRARADAADPARPLAMVMDHPALPSGDPALWPAHLQQMLKRVRALPPAWPRPDLAAQDPYALRLMAVLVALLGFVWGGSEGPRHLALALQGESIKRPPLVFEIWATPPSYTGQPARQITGAAVDLPTGTLLRVQARHAPQMPRLTWQGSTHPMQDLGSESWAAELTAAAGQLEIRARGQVLTLAVTLLPDRPPQIVIEGVPGATADDELEVEFTARDDYGVAKVEAWLRLGGDADPRPDQMIEVPLPFGKDGVHAGHWIEDLSQHEFAGQKIEFWLRAHDAAGQIGDSEVVTLTLPQRAFVEPLARALIHERGQIVRHAAAGRNALQTLSAGTRYPEDYFRDAASLIMTRAVLSRLALAVQAGRVPEMRTELAEMLWLAAKRLDDGPLANATERLTRARDRLAEALERGASEQEIAKLMDELRNAIKEFLKELMARSEQQQEQAGRGGEQRLITEQDLQDLLQQLEEAARSGQADAAQQMLSMLDQLLRGLQPQQGQGQGEGSQALQDMMRRQQGLADDSFENFRDQNRRQRGQRGQQLGEGQGEQGRGEQGQGLRDLADIARDQEALRKELEGITGGSEAADEALDRARTAMEEAEEALRDGDAGAAAQAQIDAAEALADGLRAQREQQNAQDGGRDGRNNGRDPLGRATGRSGSNDGRETRTPTEDSRARARALSEELRRRAAEQNRPEAERRLLEELLRRF